MWCTFGIHVVYMFCTCGVHVKKASCWVHHRVTGMKVAMECADSEHKRSMDAKQFKHVGPTERSLLQVLLKGRVNDFFHNEYVAVREFIPHFWETKLRHREVLLDFVRLGDQVVPPRYLICKV